MGPSGFLVVVGGTPYFAVRRGSPDVDGAYLAAVQASRPYHRRFRPRHQEHRRTRRSLLPTSSEAERQWPRALSLGVDQPIPVANRKLVLMTHCNGVHGQTCEQRPQKRHRPARRMNSPSSRSPSSEGMTFISRHEVGQILAQRPHATQSASPVSGSARNEGDRDNAGPCVVFRLDN